MNILKKMLFVAALLVASSSNATVLTFEDLSGQNALPTNYGGLNWGPSWNYYSWSQSPYNAASGVERIYNNSAVGNTWFGFSIPTVFDGAYFAGHASAQFELFNAGSLVWTSASINLSSIPTFLSSGYTGLVDQVVLNVSNGSFVMDDLTFNQGNNVPEPASLALLGLGLAGLGLNRRRKA